MFDSYEVMIYPHWIHIHCYVIVFQARRHTTEINFDQLRGRAISELEKDAIISLSTENLSGESYDDTSEGFSVSMVYCSCTSTRESWGIPVSPQPLPCVRYIMLHLGFEHEVRGGIEDIGTVLL